MQDVLDRKTQAAYAQDPYMEVHAYGSYAARNEDDALRDAWLASNDFAATSDWSALKADCGLCGQATAFRLTSDPTAPDLREGLVCGRCGCNSRVRAALGLLLERLPPPSRLSPGLWPRLRHRLAPIGPVVYLTEQVSPTFVWLQRNLAGILLGSEFEPDAKRRAHLSKALAHLGGHGQVRFQDVTRLDFADASLDAVVTFDVLEHVPDYAGAIREFARVLKPGGLCIATYPFNDRPGTLTLARLTAGGDIEHLEPAEYHGDPIRGGILCFYHFGWDMLDHFREAGFADVKMVMPYSLGQGLPYGMWTLLARR